jgi:glutamate racemase
VAPDTVVLDSAGTTAREVTRLLRAHDIESSGTTRHRILVTGPAEAFAELAQAMFRSSPEIEEIDMIANAVTGA